MSPPAFARNRTVTAPERKALQRLHAITVLARYRNAEKARGQLADLVASLNVDGVPLSHLGAVLGVSKQRAGQIKSGAS